MANAVLRDSRLLPLVSSYTIVLPEEPLFEPVSFQSSTMSVQSYIERTSPTLTTSSFLDHQSGDVSEPLVALRPANLSIVTPQPYNHAVFSSSLFVTTYTYSDGEELSFGESNNQQSSTGSQESWHFS